MPSKRAALYLLAGTFLLASLPARSGFHFGLGKAAAKTSAEVIEKARDEAAKQAITASTNTAAGIAAARLKWAQYYDESVYYSSPGLGLDGTIYFGTSHHFQIYAGYWNQGLTPPTTQYALYAYNPDGTLKWKYQDNAPSRGGAAVGSDGTIYMVMERFSNSAAATTEELHAVTSMGTLKWKAQISDRYSEIGAITPAIASDGTIYVVGSSITAFNADGTIQWTRRNTAYENSSSIYSGSPAISSAGVVYSVYWTSGTGAGQTLRALNPDGTQRWVGDRTLGTYPITCSPSVADDGTVYIGFRDSNSAFASPSQGVLAAFSSTGAFKWAYASGDNDIRSAPTIDADGTLYYGTIGSQGYLYALNPDGTLKWRYATRNDTSGGGGSDVYNSPAIGADGTIYAVSEWGWTYAFNPDGTVLWKTDQIKPNTSNWSSFALASDGTLYIGRTYGAFVAITSESLGLKSSAQWPRYRYSNQSTGRKP